MQQRIQRVPLEWHVMAALSEGRPPKFCATGETEWFETRQRAPLECFAAVVEDDSAAGFGWGAATILFIRRTDHLDGRFAVGDMVLVRERSRDGSTIQVLAGRLGLSSEGDLVATTASRNWRTVPSVVVIRHAPRLGLADAPSPFRHAAETVEYRSEASDTAEILGRIELPLPR